MNYYKLPYKGNKSKISYQLINEMKKNKPKAKVFVDLFGGLGGMFFNTLNKGFEKVIYNEYRKNIYTLVKYLIDGIKIKREPFLSKEFYQWYEKEEFLKIKDKKGLLPWEQAIKIIFSFGFSEKGFFCKR